ncbi:MAG: HNH endonuclease [Pseudobdellovibrionaceae bacterium]|nr:HNH endonuclease [Bdellovibrionales bacterium]USN48769.1 MAG: HNH endonuclease [Pseudobdellovibrionaceae bacterium]
MSSKHLSENRLPLNAVCPKRLKDLSDSDLHLTTKDLVRQERELVTKVLHHLAEIERRRLFSAYRCSSLFDYATRLLGYSESQAHRRISAMRIIREVPEVEKKLENGTLTLTNVAEARKFFRHEEKLLNTRLSKSEKVQVLARLENKSTREGERTLLAMSSCPVKAKESTRVVSPELTELKIIADHALVEKIAKLRGLLAHKLPHPTHADLLHALCDIAIRGLEPKMPSQKDRQKGYKTTALQGSTRQVHPRSLCNKAVEDAEVTRSNQSDHRSNETTTAQQVPLWQGRQHALFKMANKNLMLQKPGQKIYQTAGKTTAQQGGLRQKSLRSAIPQSIKRLVYHRDQGRCVHFGSGHALQYDHIQPVCIGGSNDVSNLRLTCRSCNQRFAIVALGQQTMQAHFGLT